LGDAEGPRTIKVWSGEEAKAAVGGARRRLHESLVTESYSVGKGLLQKDVLDEQTLVTLKAHNLANVPLAGEAGIAARGKIEKLLETGLKPGASAEDQKKFDAFMTSTPETVRAYLTGSAGLFADDPQLRKSFQLRMASKENEAGATAEEGGRAPKSSAGSGSSGAGAGESRERPQDFEGTLHITNSEAFIEFQRLTRDRKP
jgi:hypothetical protein